MANINNSISNEIDDLSIACAHLSPPERCSEYIKQPNLNLKIVHINIRSIKKNFDEFLTMLTTTKIEFDVIILTECWLKVSGPLPYLQGYSLESTSNNKSQNDGVVVYTKTSLRCVSFEPALCDSNCVVCTIDDTAIICVYRSPSYSDLEKFHHSLDSLVNTLKRYKNIALIGDINIDIKHDNHDRHSSTYLTNCASLGLLPAHLFPTRSGNCLDHVMLKSKNPATVIVFESHITDHLPVILCLKTKKCKTTSKAADVLRYNYSNIKEAIDNTDFGPVLYEPNCNLAADLLISIIQDVIKTHSHTTHVSRKCKIIKPWMTPGLVRCIRNRDRLHKKTKASPDNVILSTTYTRYRNYLNRLLKKMKRSHDKNELLKAKNNTKATWKAIKGIIHQSSPPQAPKALLCPTDTEMSINRVNDFFVSVGENLASKIKNTSGSQEHPARPAQCNSLVLEPVDIAQVKGVIDNLRGDCATGYDNIPASLLKQSSAALAIPITHICNRAIESGTFPNAFKKAVVHPIYKSGNRSNVTNYRPISVLTSLSKVLEKVLNKCLVTYLTKYKMLAGNQYGFRLGVSTEDAVLDLSKAVVDKLDKGLKCYGVFLDITKAFDSVSVPLLISKLEHIGIRGMALNIFADYLSNRSQCVKIDSICSDDRSISFGVPQGSILGPTLFILYINDLCQISIPNCDIFTYADDTALIIYDENWDKAKLRAEQSLQRVMAWLSANLLTLNIEKTKLIRFSLPHTIAPPEGTRTIKAHTCPNSSDNSTNDCSCISLSMVPDTKYLGVLIDQNLSWKPHTQALCGRIRKLIYIFKELRHSADSDTLFLVYQSLCVSVLTYCISAWGGGCKTYLIHVERAQRAILKVMQFKRRDYPTALLYSESKVLNVRQLFILRAMVRRHSLLPLDHLVLKKRKGHPVCGSVQCRTSFASRHFNVLSIRMYNKIHRLIGIYTLSSNQLKTKLTSWLQQLSYENTERILENIS